MRGLSNQPPLWALIIDAALLWKMSPMQVEAETDGYWWSRWLVYRREAMKAGGQSAAPNPLLE